MSHVKRSMRRKAAAIAPQPGGHLTFGFMPQNNISGRSLTVTGLRSYIFESDSFASYSLHDDDADITLIVADAGRKGGSYIALSQAIDKKWFNALFGAAQPESWFDLAAGEEVSCAIYTLATPQGWLVADYTLALATKGRVLEGDYSRHSLSDLAGREENGAFDYLLLVDEEGGHALEAERRADGSIQVFATVYRPLSDIESYSPPTQPYIVRSNSAPVRSQPALPPKAKAPEPAKAAEPAAPVTPEASPEPALDYTPPATPGAYLAELTLPEAVAEAVAAEPEKPAPAQPLPADVALDASVAQAASPSSAVASPAVAAFAAASPPASMLACETELAARIIDEAKRNRMTMSDVIRKVIDMPLHVKDEVFVPFLLTDEEYKELAERYSLAADDRAAIHVGIVEELRQFAGIKKKG